MTELLAEALRIVYLVDAFALLALADRLATVRPLARAFMMLSSVALVGLVIGKADTNVHAYTRNALHAVASAACAWAVLSTCRPNGTRAPWFAFAAALSWLGATRLPRDEHVVSFFAATVPSWQATAAWYWFGIWAAWSAIALVGFVRMVRAPIKIAHVLALLVAASVATESIGMLVWAARPDGYMITLVVDMCLALAVGAVTGFALWAVKGA